MDAFHFGCVHFGFVDLGVVVAGLKNLEPCPQAQPGLTIPMRCRAVSHCARSGPPPQCRQCRNPAPDAGGEFPRSRAPAGSGGRWPGAVARVSDAHEHAAQRRARNPGRDAPGRPTRHPGAGWSQAPRRLDAAGRHHGTDPGGAMDRAPAREPHRLYRPAAAAPRGKVQAVLQPRTAPARARRSRAICSA